MMKLRELPAGAALVLAMSAGGVACAAAALPAGESAAPAAVVDQEGLVPPGYGTLKQDEVTLSLRQGPLLVKVTPLAEAVTRLLAPDTYARLHGLAETRARELTGMAARPAELFLVSFFSYSPDVAFQPEDVQLLHQGQLLRPVQILPITTGFGSQRLQQQENQSAVFAFEGPIDYDQVFTLRYGAAESDNWSNVRAVLRAERNKVMSRVGK
jgi:hypothetical protein